MANPEINIIVKAVDKFSKNFDALSKKMSGITNQAKKVAKVVGVVGAGGAGLAIKEFATFEKQMSKVKAITGATDEEFKKLTAIAKKMGATTAFTGKEAGDALEFLGMAGLSVKESMDALPGTLQLAAAGNLELGEAADISTNIMAQFGIEAKNIGRVNDVLAKSATSANTSVGEMAEAMKYVGPVANSFGISLEESAAAIDVLANNGIKGGLAGQSFSASLLRISKPTDQMVNSMNELNLKLFDQNGKYIGITKTIKQLEKGTKNMTDEQKAQHIATVFGIQSTKQWLTLLKDGSGELEDYTKELKNAGGTAGKMAKTQLNNLSGSFTLLKSAISGILIEVGESLNKYLRPAIDGLTEFLGTFREKWKNLSPEMQKIITVVGSISVGFVGILTVIGAVAMVLPVITGGFSALAGVLGILTGPIGLVVAAITGLAVAYKTNFLGFGDVVNSAAERLSGLFNDIIDSVKGLYDGICEWIGRIEEPFMKIVEFLQPFIEEFLDVLFEYWQNTFENIVVVLEGIWQVIKGIFEVAFSLIGGMIEVFLNVVTGDWEGAWEAIKIMIANVWEGIKNIFGGQLKIISGLVNQFIDSVSAFFKSFWIGLKTIFTYWGNIIRDVVSGVWGAISGLTASIWNGLTGMLIGVWNGIWSFATSIFTNIKNTIISIFQAAIDFVMEAWEKIEGIRNSVGNIKDKTVGAMGDAANWVGSNVSGAWNYVTGGRAYGGSVSAGSSYVVGERGRELFVPETNGKIIPNSELGGKNISINFGDVHISNGQTERDFFRKVRRVMIEVQRGS